MAVGVDFSSGIISAFTATRTWGALIVYCFLVGMTAAFLLMYIKRMLTIGFLIVISPLITITYSIDKAKDGKAQALNTWFREFMVTVLIQPFHCIIYLIFISTVLNTLGTKASLTTMILAIICMRFMWTAEGIVKNIFNLKDNSGLGDMIAAGLTVRAISGAVGRAGASAASGSGSITKFGQNIMSKAPTPMKNAATAVKNAGNMFASTKVGGAITKAGGVIAKAEYTVAKKGLPLATGAAVASAEMGLNTKANALQVGAEAHRIMKGAIDARTNADGSKQNIILSQDQLKKCAEYISRNNNFGFENYKTVQADKDNLKSYAQSLIGTNMDYLQNSIQAALSALTAANPTEYNTTSAAGMQHLRDLQDMALNTSLDFNDPSTNPLGHAWTTEEKQVVTAIQTRDFARDVNRLYAQMQASGSNNPAQDVDNYINSL